jgi:hypothetical protein
MAEEPLQGRKGDVFLSRGNGKGVSQHMRFTRLSFIDC